jgi:hypothetical protein
LTFWDKAQGVVALKAALYAHTLDPVLRRFAESYPTTRSFDVTELAQQGELALAQTLQIAVPARGTALSHRSVTGRPGGAARSAKQQRRNPPTMAGATVRDNEAPRPSQIGGLQEREGIATARGPPLWDLPDAGAGGYDTPAQPAPAHAAACA